MSVSPDGSEHDQLCYITNAFNGVEPAWLTDSPKTSPGSTGGHVALIPREDGGGLTQANLEGAT